MRKLFLILTIVCLLVTLTVLNTIPVSADTLIITPPQGGSEDPGDPQNPHDPSMDPRPVIRVEVAIPEAAEEELFRAAERNPILEYEVGPVTPEPQAS